jgi:hypothetical protein
MEFTTLTDHVHVQDVSKKDFKESWIKTNKPVLIKGLLDQTPASKWDLNFLEKEIGHFKVKVFDSQHKNRTAYLRGDHYVSMNHMLHLIRENKPSDLRMFVNPILSKNKKLAKEIPCPDFFTCRFQLPNMMFLGGKGTVVPLHYDFMYDDGLLLQLFGRKEIILVEPKQAHLLYRIPFNSTSMVNLFQLDVSDYPALKKLKAYRVTLDHGDTIFIPSGYWHQMIYTDASLSIGFRKWHRNPFVTFKTGVIRLTQIPFDKSLSLIFGKYWFNWKVNQSKRFEKSH